MHRKTGQSLTSDEGYFRVEIVCLLQGEGIRTVMGDLHRARRKKDEPCRETRGTLAQAKRAAESQSGKGLLQRRGEQWVDLGDTDYPELFAKFGTLFAVLGFAMGRPRSEYRHEALAARLLGDFPDPSEYLGKVLAIARRLSLSHGRISAPSRPGIEPLDRRFATVAERLAHIVDHARMALPPSIGVTLLQARPRLFSNF